MNRLKSEKTLSKSISRLLEDLNYLKQENKTKNSIIQPLIQSGNTDNYENDNSYSRSNDNDENNNNGIENDDINIHIPNDDCNITIKHRKNKSHKDKSTFINNKNKNSNKIIAKMITIIIMLRTNTIKAVSPAVVV